MVMSPELSDTLSKDVSCFNSTSPPTRVYVTISPSCPRCLPPSSPGTTHISTPFSGTTRSPRFWARAPMTLRRNRAAPISGHIMPHSFSSHALTGLKPLNGPKLRSAMSYSGICCLHTSPTSTQLTTYSRRTISSRTWSMAGDGSVPRCWSTPCCPWDVCVHPRRSPDLAIKSKPRKLQLTRTRFL